MESAPLVLVSSLQILHYSEMVSDNPVQAYSHARNAAVETHKANPTAASEEHDLAAGEFASAAGDTADVEASASCYPY